MMEIPKRIKQIEFPKAIRLDQAHGTYSNLKITYLSLSTPLKFVSNGEEACQTVRKLFGRVPLLGILPIVDILLWFQTSLGVY